MTASFLFFSTSSGSSAGWARARSPRRFVDGARDLLGVALIIGIARGITVIMTNGLITDTVLNWAEVAVADLGGVLFINLMYALFLPALVPHPVVIGLATVAMPIMAPLASLADVARAARRHGIPVGKRPASTSSRPTFGRRHGRPRHRACRLWHLAAASCGRCCCCWPCSRCWYSPPAWRFQ